MDRTSARPPYTPDLARLTARLEQMRVRLDELHGSQAYREGADASLVLRLDDLAGQVGHLAEELRSARQREGQTAARLDALAEAVQGLSGEAAAITGALSDLGAQPDAGAMLGGLEERMRGAEDEIAQILARLDESGAGDATAPHILIAINHQIEQTAGTLDSHGKRLRDLEARLGDGVEPSAVVADAQAGLARRLDGLEGAIEDVRGQALNLRHGEHLWTQDRLARLGRRTTAGLGLLALLALGLGAAGWWWTRETLDQTNARLAALETPLAPDAASDARDLIAPLALALERMDARNAALLERLAMGPAPVPPAGVPEDLDGRLVVLGQAHAETAQGVREARDLMARMEQRLDGQDEDRGQIADLLEQVRLSVTKTDQRLAALESGMAGLSAPAALTDQAVTEGATAEPASAVVEEGPRDPVAQGAETLTASEPVAVPSEATPAVQAAAAGASPAASESAPEAAVDPSAEVPDEAPAKMIAVEDTATAASPAGADEEATVPAAGPTASAGSPGTAAAPGTPRVLAEERFIVQLIGFRSESSVASFAQDMGITEQARYQRIRFRGRPWYAVVLGDYATQAEALAAVAAMPAELRALDPWVRAVPAGSELIPIH